MVIFHCYQYVSLPESKLYYTCVQNGVEATNPREFIFLLLVLLSPSWVKHVGQILRGSSPETAATNTCWMPRLLVQTLNWLKSPFLASSSPFPTHVSRDFFSCFVDFWSLSLSCFNLCVFVGCLPVFRFPNQLHPCIGNQNHIFDPFNILHDHFGWSSGFLLGPPFRCGFTVHHLQYALLHVPAQPKGLL